MKASDPSDVVPPATLVRFWLPYSVPPLDTCTRVGVPVPVTWNGEVGTVLSGMPTVVTAPVAGVR